MKRALVALAAYLAFASFSFAQQNAADAPASRAQVEKYLELVHLRELFRVRVDAGAAQLHEIIHGVVQKHPELPPDFEVRMDKMADDLLKGYPTDEAIDVTIPVYEKNLTSGEVDALIAFYSTPAGQSIVRKLPAITAEATQATTGIMQRLMAKIMQRVQEELGHIGNESDGKAAKKTQQN
jgi:uncharacterized protein